MIWFTSDTHFGHKNIIQHCARPFADAAAMDEALIANWNARVGPDDDVYHLGDFTLKSRGFARRIFARLQGQIRVLGLPWHHDRGWVPRQPGLRDDLVSASGHPVEILPPLLALRFPASDGGRHTVTLSHYPLAEWEAAHHGAWQLHGHSHGGHRRESLRRGGAVLDVGVDCFDFRPISLAEVEAEMARLSPRQGAPRASI